MKEEALKAGLERPRGRVLGRTLAEELERVRGGHASLADTTLGYTGIPGGPSDYTGGYPYQPDGD